MTRTVSLLPAATEVVAALGLVDELVGVSHECDFPPGVEGKPRVTRCEAHGRGLSSAAIDRWVADALELLAAALHPGPGTDPAAAGRAVPVY